MNKNSFQLGLETAMKKKTEKMAKKKGQQGQKDTVLIKTAIFLKAMPFMHEVFFTILFRVI